jgi:GGDEF domain-containing protein
VALGERVRVALAAPFRISAGVVRVSGSVGVAMLDGSVTLARALAAADAASYAAKRSGGDRVELTWCTELGLTTPRS